MIKNFKKFAGLQTDSFVWSRELAEKRDAIPASGITERHLQEARLGADKARGTEFDAEALAHFNRLLGKARAHGDLVESNRDGSSFGRGAQMEAFLVKSNLMEAATPVDKQMAGRKPSRGGSSLSTPTNAMASASRKPPKGALRAAMSKKLGRKSGLDKVAAEVEARRKARSSS